MTDETRENQTEIFRLMLDAGEANRLRAAELIRKLSPAERGSLRAACSGVDYLIDDVWLAELRLRRATQPNLKP